MKKLLLMALAMTCLWTTTHAQVGINTTTPNATLEVVGTDSGILIPRVALTATNVAAPITTPTTSELIYNTASAGTGVNAVTPGYYYWNGTIWVRLNAGTDATTNWSLTGNSGIDPATNFIGTVTNHPLAFRTNDVERMRILSSNGNVGINTSTPNTILEVNATDSGILIPRVALTSANNSAPIDSPTQSELIFNTAIAGIGENAVSPGYYYWDGYRWTRLGGSRIVYETTAFDNWFIASSTGNQVMAELPIDYTLELSKPTLVEIKISFDVVITLQTGTWPENPQRGGYPILYGFALFNGDFQTGDLLMKDARSYTSRPTDNGGSIPIGFFTLQASRYIYLETGMHSLNLYLFGMGGASTGSDRGFDITVMNNDLSYYQIILHD